MSSKGSVTVVFRGYSVSAAINVGHHGDPDQEARKFHAAEDEGRQQIGDVSKELQQIYDRYQTGQHPWQRHRTLLDQGRGEPKKHDYRLGFRLPPSLGQSDYGFEFRLFVKDDAPAPLRDKVLANFQLSQFSDGPLAPLYKEVQELDRYSHSRTSLGDQLVATWESRSWNERAGLIGIVLQGAGQREADLRTLVRKGAVKARHLALLACSALDQAPIPALAFDLLKEFSADDAAMGPAANLIRFLPDGQWDEGLDRLRSHFDVEKLLGSARDWWRSLLGT